MFLIDCWPDYEKNCMKLWLDNGTSVIRPEKFTPSFYVKAHRREDVLYRYLKENSSINSFSREKKLIDLRMKSSVIKVTPEGYHIREVASEIDRMGGYEDYELFNVDISLPQRYLFERDAFPMMNMEGDSHFAVEYETPPLKELSFDAAVKSDRIPSFQDPLLFVRLRDREDSFEIDGTEEEIIGEFEEAVRGKDPDILYSYGGDGFVFPYLLFRSEQCGIPLELGREKGTFRKEGKSYFSYGRIVFKPSQYLLKGRMHIDTKSSFHYKEGGLAGLIELARMSRIPMQRLSRLSPGSAISSMQLYEAHRRGVLIPWRKQTPENFKTALQLIKADRGGHILEPEVGIHEDVSEVDFTSLYPNIINKFNISPETVLCPCCHDSSRRVPVLNYHICEKRRGFLPNVVKPLIVKRALYKKSPDFAGRRALLKWVLVTCFGYLGYKNARFGRIECHESVTAFAREILLEAMHMAEEEGFCVMHGIVDSLWLRKKTTREEFETLCAKISERIGIPLELEGMYSWIVFLPSKRGIGALNRYYGVIDGEVKARGLELRMKNQPPLIKNMQEAMLRELAQADGRIGFLKKIPCVLEVVRAYARAVSCGDVPLEDLVISVGVSHDLKDYSVHNLSVAALRNLEREEVKVSPGQAVRYIIRNAKARRLTDRVTIPELARDSVYDREKYMELLVRATSNMLSPFGFCERRVADFLKKREQTTLVRFYDGGCSRVDKTPWDSRPCGTRISHETCVVSH
jgi:DNA polymerase elongation subunit (family B)